MKQLPYTASDKRQRPLITVLAENEDHARQEIKKQLNQNESRRACYTQWMAAGQPIKIKRTIDTEELFRDAYKGCESYGDWDRLIAQMTDDLRNRIYDALVLVQATCGVTMREDAFIIQLKHHLPKDTPKVEHKRQIDSQVAELKEILKDRIIKHEQDNAVVHTRISTFGETEGLRGCLKHNDACIKTYNTCLSYVNNLNA